MAGKIELLTPSNGKVALVGENTAVDVTVTVPASTGTVLTTASNTNFPTGSVLQVFTGESAGSSTTSGTLVNLTSSSISITPKSTNSKIHIFATFGSAITSGGSGTNSTASFRLMEGSTGFGQQNALWVASGAGINAQSQAPASLSASVTNNSTSNRGFTVGGFKTGGTSAASISNVRITLIEVAA
jgi:hypothetical protein